MELSTYHHRLSVLTGRNAGRCATPGDEPDQQPQEVRMLHQSPADFCTEYARKHTIEPKSQFGDESTVGEATVVHETADTARVEALRHTFGHAPDAGYYEAIERTAFVLVKRDDGWHVHSTEDLGCEYG